MVIGFMKNTFEEGTDPELRTAFRSNAPATQQDALE
jgi:hypothetical protein